MTLRRGPDYIVGDLDSIKPESIKWLNDQVPKLSIFYNFMFSSEKIPMKFMNLKSKTRLISKNRSNSLAQNVRHPLQLSL